MSRFRTSFLFAAPLQARLPAQPFNSVQDEEDEGVAGSMEGAAVSAAGRDVARRRPAELGRAVGVDAEAPSVRALPVELGLSKCRELALFELGRLPFVDIGLILSMRGPPSAEPGRGTGALLPVLQSQTKPGGAVGAGKIRRCRGWRS